MTQNFLTEQQKAQIAYARKFFSWANKQGETWQRDPTTGRSSRVQLPPFTEEEIWGVLERCARWRLNPADNNQVQIWKDKNGVIVEPAYQVMLNWLDAFGPHSAIKYVRLVDDAAKNEGSTDPRDLVYRAEVVMFSEVAAGRAAGLPIQDALTLATHTGVGRVAASEYLNDNGSERAYAAPNGRPPSDKAKKRAVIDMINDMGTPTDDEYQSMASLNRAVAVLPSDFSGTESLAWNDARALATARAEERQLPAPEPEDIAEAKASLWTSVPPAAPENDEPAGTEETETATQPPHPWDAATTLTELGMLAAQIVENDASADAIETHPAKRGVFIKALENCFDGDASAKEHQRQIATWWLFGTEEGTSKTLKIAQIRAWRMTYTPDGKTLADFARSEMGAVFHAGMADAGQQALPLAATNGEPEQQDMPF